MTYEEIIQEKERVLLLCEDKTVDGDTKSQAIANYTKLASDWSIANKERTLGMAKEDNEK